MKRMLLILLLATPLTASDEFTLYELQAPESHSFAITYDDSQTKEGATVYFNAIRAGSVASKEKVIAHTTGAELPFDIVTGKEAKAAGQLPATTSDDAKFIRVTLPAPVPKGGRTRLRIIKTYTDAASYGLKDGQLVFNRPLGIKRNVVLLPKGWEVVECGSPAMVSTDPDGRARVSVLNDRDDQLPVRIVGRLAPATGANAQEASFHRAEQSREIRYLLLDPATHQFFISHDFTVSRAGQASVHSFVRKGSVVAPDAKMINLDTGKALPTKTVTGKSVNELGYYPNKTDDDTVVVQGDLETPVAAGRSARIRVEETYTDPVGYTLDGSDLVWKRTLGRPFNFVTLPAGWMLMSVNTPATITQDDKGRTTLRFINTRNEELSVAIRARKRPTPPAAR